VVARSEAALVVRAQFSASWTLLRAFATGRRREYPAFIILSRGRSGSTLSDDNLSSFVRNHDEVRQALTGTRHERLFDEP
jgi:hypothetical protein